MLVQTSRGAFEVVDGGGTQAPVVLVHAFPFDGRQWLADAEALAPSLRVIAPSMRGFGGSAGWEGVPSVEAMADDAAAVLDALDVREPVIVGGMSMGGYVALAFARRYPARLRALVLADTRADADSDEARANRDRAIAQIERGDLAGFVEAQLGKLLSRAAESENPALVARTREAMLEANPAAVVAALQALRDRPDARDVLAGVSVPALVIVGAEDRVTPPAIAQAMATALPDATVHVLPHAGHLSNLEQPERFREALEAFVARV